MHCMLSRDNKNEVISVISRDPKKRSAVLHYRVVDQTELFRLTLD